MVFRERDSVTAEPLETTLMFAEALTLPLVAVMVAVPGAMPVILPKLFTVATPSLEELRLTSA